MGSWLSKNLGWKVSLGTAIVPNWRDGRLALKDVSIDLGDVQQPYDQIPAYEEQVPLEENYTRFSIQFERLEVRISLRRWLEGRGWLEEVFIDGAKGILDKRWIRSIEDWRWKSKPGDFNLDSLQLRNVHLSIIQPSSYRPYNVTILSANIPRLRASWLFYDFLSAESAHGIFDGRCLFTLHTTSNDERELKHFRMLGLDVRHLSQSSADNALGWVTRGTVDIEGFYQLPFDGSKDDQSFPRGAFDFNPDTLKEKILLPLLKGKEEKEEIEVKPLRHWYETKIKPHLSDEILPFADKIASMPERIATRISQSNKTAYLLFSFCYFFYHLVGLLSSLKDVDFGGLESAEEAAEHFLKAPEDSLAVQVDFIFRNLRAKLPAEEMNSARGALLRPVIGYVNEQRPLIPLSCHFTLKQSQFEGAWSGYESGLIGALASGLEGAFQKLVWDPERRMQRIGKIGRWTLGNYLKNSS